MLPQRFPENLWQSHAHEETVDQGSAVLLGALTEEVIQHFTTWADGYWDGYWMVHTKITINNQHIAKICSPSGLKF